MDGGFNEQVVKRVNKPKQLVIKIVAVLIVVMLPFIAAGIAILTGVQYIFVVGLFLTLAGIYGVWYVFSLQKVEFEYSVAGNDLDIYKIISLRKRKPVCRVPINEITVLTREEKEVENVRVTKAFVAPRDVDTKDENYYALFNSPAFGKCLLVFSPNEQILDGMRVHLDKLIVHELFYKNKQR